MIDFEFSYDQFDSPLLSRDPFSISKLGIEIGHHLIHTYIEDITQMDISLVIKINCFRVFYFLHHVHVSSILLSSYRAFRILFLSLNSY